MPPWRWTWAIAGALAMLTAILAFESRYQVLSTRVGLEWARRDRLPCPGLTGAFTAMPLFIAMAEKIDRTSRGGVVLLGDSTFTSSPGCGIGELPADQTFQSRLKAALDVADIPNLALWSADWPILSRQTSLLRLIQQSSSATPVWVVMSNLPIPIGHLHPVLFAQLCHHPSCDRVCRQLCMEESESRSGGLWSFFRYLPAIANPMANLASYVQTFVTAAPVTARPVPRAGRLGWRTLGSEREVTALYERELVTFRDPEEYRLWLQEGGLTAIKAGELLRATWTENGLLQLWYKEWMRQLRGLKGRFVFVSPMPNPDFLARLRPHEVKLIEEVRAWMDQQTLHAIPDARIVSLRLPGEDYYDTIHWTPAGASEAARQVAAAIAVPAKGTP